MLALYQIDYIGENPKTAENSIKSNLRKPDSLDPASPNDEMKKRVQWMDFVGKELVEIREFEWEDIDQLVIHNGSESSKPAIKLIMKTLIRCVLVYSKLLLPNWSNQQVK